jgi:hypothetical protein
LSIFAASRQLLLHIIVAAKSTRRTLVTNVEQIPVVTS